MRCTRPTDDGDIDDLGSIFGIETDSKPPPTICFKTLPTEAVSAATKQLASTAFKPRDFVKTFHTAMGLEFEKLERLPFRPQVDKHSGKFGYRDALQESKKSDFLAFAIQPQQFVFLNWPKLDGTDKSTITFSSKNVATVHAVPAHRVPVNVHSEPQSKPSESVENHVTKIKYVMLWNSTV